MSDPIETAPEANPPRDAWSWFTGTLYARRGVLTALGILAGLGLGFQLLWESVGPSVAQNARFRVTPASTSIPAPPPWVRHDVIAAAFQRAKLAEGLSVLAPAAEFDEPLAAAFAADPWVRRVGPIVKSHPNRVAIELEYRRPTAAVVMPGGLLPIDADAVLLPSGELTGQQLSWMPRIELRSLTQRPPAIGQAWSDPRLAGAASLVEAFGPLWEELDLLAVRVDSTPEVRAGRRFWSYNLLSTGDTTVLWGAAPNAGPPDEASFDTKLNRLRGFITKHGPLDSVVNSPEILDVRDGIEPFRRVVLREGKRVASKPDDEEAKVK